MFEKARLVQGARNAIRVCMGVGAADKVFILTDNDTQQIAQVLESEAKAAGAKVTCVCIEEFGTRPMTQLPDGLKKRMVSFAPTVTFYTAGVQPNELGLRSAMINLALGKLGARHAHMPGITERIMQEGMRGDYHKINELTMQVYEIVRRARTIVVTSSNGTDLHVEFDRKLKWSPQGGLLHKPGSFGNLPEGEIFTTPAKVEGVFVAQGMGDYFGHKYGVLSHPLKVTIANSHVSAAECKINGLADELLAYLDTAENARRVGEFAIGTNLGISDLCGSILQDEKIPGTHIAFGNPLAQHTGADWTSNIHVDIVSPRCSVVVDGEPLLKNGHFKLPKLK